MKPSSPLPRRVTSAAGRLGRIRLLAVLVVVIACLFVLVSTAVRSHEASAPNAHEAKTAGVRWAGGGIAEQVRRDDDVWEVDILQPDGSIVEVTLDDRLQLLEFDQELGPGGTPPADELRGRARVLAVERALEESGPARVLAVEREIDGTTEVDLRLADGRVVEVGLDRQMRVTEVALDDAGDE